MPPQHNAVLLNIVLVCYWMELQDKNPLPVLEHIKPSTDVVISLILASSAEAAGYI